MELHRNLATWERAASMLAGAALLTVAAKRRRPFGAASFTGVSLIARGVSGFCPVVEASGRTGRARLRRADTREALGGPKGTNLTASVKIARNAQDLFGAWRDLTVLPRFIRGLERVVRTGRDRTAWTFRGPGGIPLQWEAEVINEIEPSLIAWRSLPGSDVVSAGSVHFDETADGGTYVTVSMQVSPPGGRLASAAAWLFGRGPSTDLQQDLHEFKRLMEAGVGAYGF